MAKTKKPKPILGREIHISTTFHTRSGQWRASALVGVRHQGYSDVRMKPVGDGNQQEGSFDSPESALAAAKKQLGMDAADSGAAAA